MLNILYSGTFKIADLMQLPSPHEIASIQSIDVQPDDTFQIHFTSGTTGQPKGAVRSHFSSLNNALCIARRYNLDPNENERYHKLCVQNPLFHSMGVLGGILVGLSLNGTLILPGLSFKAIETLQAVAEERYSWRISGDNIYQK